MPTTAIKNEAVERHARAIGIDESVRKTTCEALNLILADYHIYYQNLRGLHWNIGGPVFFSLHPKFEELYDDADLHIDEIAERILSLGLMPTHSLKDYLQNARLKETPTVSQDSAAVLAMMDNIEKLIRYLRETKETVDAGTEDQLIGYLRAHEKTIWMFAAYLDKD